MVCVLRGVHATQKGWDMTCLDGVTNRRGGTDDVSRWGDEQKGWDMTCLDGVTSRRGGTDDVSRWGDE